MGSDSQSASLAHANEPFAQEQFFASNAQVPPPLFVSSFAAATQNNAGHSGSSESSSLSTDEDVVGDENQILAAADALTVAFEALGKQCGAVRARTLLQQALPSRLVQGLSIVKTEQQQHTALDADACGMFAGGCVHEQELRRLDQEREQAFLSSSTFDAVIAVACATQSTTARQITSQRECVVRQFEHARRQLSAPLCFRQQRLA